MCGQNTRHAMHAVYTSTLKKKGTFLAPKSVFVNFINWRQLSLYVFVLSSDFISLMCLMHTDLDEKKKIVRFRIWQTKLSLRINSIRRTYIREDTSCFTNHFISTYSMLIFFISYWERFLKQIKGKTISLTHATFLNLS